MSDYEWWENENHKAVIIVKHVQAIAVYENEEGDVIIRQEADYPCPDDHGDEIIRFEKVHIDGIIRSLQQIKGKDVNAPQ